MKLSLFHFAALALFVGAALQAALGGEVSSPVADVSKLPPAVTATVDFTKDIQPIFSRHCATCHGPEKQKGGLRLHLKAAALKGGDTGKAILPGMSAESPLIQRVAGLNPDEVMPPKGERISAREIGLLRAWIDQGANWPDDAKAERVRSEHWALQKLKMPEMPAIISGINSENPIDRFIVARLAKDGLQLSPPADRATLIRRLSFDLLGLPPKPGEIDAFVADTSPRAYEDLVDRMLASPQYGERWGRHWLDAARFTESHGFEFDRLRENGWQYRDYVIKSFNDDAPYDRFMREQIAGDVLAPVTRDGIVGTAFLVCGSYDEAGNGQSNSIQRAIAREDEMEDVVSVVGQTFLGLTVNCARCHSHKFDPIPQEDYYRLKAVFEGVKHGERSIASAEEVKAREERNRIVNAEIAAAQLQIKAIEAEGAKHASEKNQSAEKEPGPAPFAKWVFDGSENAIRGELKGSAKIENWRLRLLKEGAFFQSEPLPRDIGEKTLEAWITLADLNQSGGAAISIERDDGQVFDAIVYGERQPKKWIAGSNFFARTSDLQAPEESAAPGAAVHVAVVYRSDNSIAVFRNGEPYGQPYTPKSPLQTFKAGSSRILLGLRHTGSGPSKFRGEVIRAALYDRALSDAEIAASFRAAGRWVTQTEILAHLNADQRAQRETALARIAEFRKQLDSTKPSVSYVGTRVQPEPTKLLVRGDVKSPGEIVTPGGLSAVVDLDCDFGLAADAPEAQRRIKFAAWLADPRNPLPARVMANRIWHLHFGQGLVATPNDFGVNGARPSHPELLDWLALKFIESGWSVKALHRLIVSSETYKQASESNAKAAAIDADNTLLWRFTPRRLEGEAVRDAILAVSGQLNLQAGGPSFRPFTISTYGANFYHLVDRDEPEFNRRTVYRMNVNSGKDPLLDAFDCPEPSVKTPRRGVTTTPLQALGLMNSAFVERQAAHFAARVLKESGNDLPSAVQTAYRLALGRKATDAEAQRAIAAAKERGIVSVCWALLNATEFVYVR